MGPGDHPFARFGHNAILLEWPRTERALVYNFGTFAFDGLDGVRDFMAGRFRYWLSVSTLGRTLRFYAAQNRTLVAQELDLTDAERLQLAEALATNALPENRFYDYDYYYDNCSTRVRDAVDRVLFGEVKRKVNGPGRLTFREHTERLTADAFWVYLGLDLALGPLTDRPTRRWEELFIPQELHDALATVTRDRDGHPVKLVRTERVLLTADREPVRSTPPSRVLGFGAAGVVLGGAFAALGSFARRQRVARALFSGFVAVIGLLLGLLGTIFLVFWGFTKHWSAYRNENVLVCPPWALVLVLTAVGLATRRRSSELLTHRVITASAISSAAAVLLACIPHFGQDNTRMAALLAPLWFGIYVGSARLGGFALTRPLAPRDEPVSPT
jgi:hypothetical protein